MKTIPDNLDFLMNHAVFLILEDVLGFRTQLIHDLRNLKINGTFHEAGTIEDAHKILNTKKIDFIISDWNLPDGSGYDFLIEVRKIPIHEKTPFIIWTARNEVSNVVNAIKAGANEYFSKPWTQKEIELKIYTAWKQVHGQKKSNSKTI